MSENASDADYIETAVRRANEAEWVRNELHAAGLPETFRLMASIALDQYICDLGARDKNAKVTQLQPLGMIGCVTQSVSAADVKKIDATLLSMGERARKAKWHYACRITQIWRAMMRIESMQFALEKAGFEGGLAGITAKVLKAQSESAAK